MRPASTSRRSSAWCRRSNPRLVILVTVDEPQLAIFGGVVAAPAFAQIAAFDLQYLEVPPDLRAPLSPPVDSPAVMDLERLVAALGAAEVVGRAPVEVRDLAYDARTVTPGAVFFCVPGAQADGHDFAAEAVAARRRRARRRAAARAAVPQVVVPDARAAMALAADEFFGEPTEELEVVGVTGTSGKTTTSFLLFAILAAAGRRPGLLGTVEARVGGERRGVRAHDARGDRAAAAVPRDARRRRPLVRDGGVVARVGAAPARPRPLRRARLHEPQPGPPRLPRRHGVRTSRRSGGCSSSGAARPR